MTDCIFSIIGVGVCAGGFAARTHTHLPRFIEKIRKGDKNL